MLNFRNTNLVFIIMLVGIAVTDYYYHVSPWVYVTLAFIYSLILFYGSYYVGSNFFMKVLCASNTTQKKIAISFDDGPAMSFTPEILEILREKNVAATFFCIGKRIAGNDQMLSDIHAQGHLIGNHSFSHHFWFDLFSTKKMLADVNSMNHEVDRVIGLKPRLFRPPYGVTTPNMRNVMKRGGYQAIGWNIRSLDTVIKDPVRLRKKIEGMIQPGAVILLHDTSAATTEMLAALIDNIRAKGYEFERIDKLLNIEAYA